MKPKTFRIDFGSRGEASNVSATKRAWVVRDQTAMILTASEMKAGDLVMFTPLEDRRTYRELIAAGGIAELISIVSVSTGRTKT